MLELPRITINTALNTWGKSKLTEARPNAPEIREKEELKPFRMAWNGGV